MTKTKVVIKTKMTKEMKTLMKNTKTQMKTTTVCNRK
jgi:hypothetical protein